VKRETYLKIDTLDKIGSVLEKLKKKNKKVVHCHGVFDLLHPGHLKHFEAAKKKGDILVVSLTPDRYVNRGPGRPIFNQNLRAESIAAIECVDYVTINEQPTAVDAIKKLRPNFYVKGIDYVKEDDVTEKIYEEKNVVESVGGEMYFTDEINFSSTSLINTFFSPYSEEAKGFLLEFKKRYSMRNVIDCLKGVEDVKVLVIGDIIIDEYHYCAGIGKPLKDNIVATKYINEEIFAGGVLAAANHLAGFCKDVTLVSCIGGKNNYTDFIINHLKPNIKTNFYYHNENYTVVKRRFVEPNFLTKLFEVCYLESTDQLPQAIEQEICDYLTSSLREFDLVVVTDFGHGLMTPRIIKTLCDKANFLAVGVQTNSANLGFNVVTKFPRADYICIDEPEIRLACHDRRSNLEELILEISNKLDCEKVIITRGHKGSLVYSKKEGFVNVPVFSKEVLDRVGAGDAFFSVTSPCVYKNNPIDMMGFIGNAVGAMKVLIVGNRSAIEPGHLLKYITTLLK
jgi:rfaE bifunctional protein nucleotidyltransferase chain/domain